jgi:predicted RNase H-like HicB family nuclease
LLGIDYGHEFIEAAIAERERRQGDAMPVEAPMKYKVALYRSEEGYSVSVPGLPGCCSQGETEQEALENIAVAIREYLEVAAQLAEEAEAREVEVAV